MNKLEVGKLYQLLCGEQKSYNKEVFDLMLIDDKSYFDIENFQYIDNNKIFTVLDMHPKICHLSGRDYYCYKILIDGEIYTKFIRLYENFQGRIQELTEE